MWFHIFSFAFLIFFFLKVLYTVLCLLADLFPVSTSLDQGVRYVSYKNGKIRVSNRPN